DFRGGSGDHAGVVGLDAADGDQRVGAGGDGVRDDIFELSQLVTAKGEAGIAVLALGVKLDIATKMGGQAVELFDRRRSEGERIALEFGEIHGRPFHSFWCVGTTYCYHQVDERCSLFRVDKLAIFMIRLLYS